MSKKFYWYQHFFVIGMLVFTLNACRLFAPQADLEEPAEPVTPTAAPSAENTLQSPTQTATARPLSSPTAGLTATTIDTVVPNTAFCDYDPDVAAILEGTTAESWLDWIEKLSGAEPVTIDGEETTIETRFSVSMFDGSPQARAFEFVQDQVLGWYPEDQVEEMDYTVTRESDNTEFTWKNLIVTIPGKTNPDEIVILSAHLDSMSETPETSAPGAEDNASGSAALLEAARLLKDAQFERTVQIIWFTGEELGLFGSRAYVEQIDDPDQVVGVVNLDMFGYDSDNDRCFEMHVGTMPESDQVGRCFTGAIDAYKLDLPNYDYLESEATDRSDHGPFWQSGIGAIEILENMFDNDLQDDGQPRACTNGDMNPNYHTPKDTVDRINGESGVEIVRAAIATIAAMAQPVE